MNKNVTTLTDDYCYEFYEKQIFRAILHGSDLFETYLHIAFKNNSEADQSFIKVDTQIFKIEMTSLRLELFSLAWLHQFIKIENVLPQTIFTKRYLFQTNHSNIWQIMAEYNKAIAQSSIDLAKTDWVKRGWITYINSFRASLFDEWVKENIDLECVARVINRTGTEVAWEKGLTVRRLAERLISKLGCDSSLKDNVVFKLEAILVGFYDGAKESFIRLTF